MHEGVPVWSATNGSYTMPRERFTERLHTFHKLFMQGVAERVNGVAGKLPPDVHIGIPWLLREFFIRQFSHGLGLPLCPCSPIRER